MKKFTLSLVPLLFLNAACDTTSPTRRAEPREKTVQQPAPAEKPWVANFDSCQSFYFSHALGKIYRETETDEILKREKDCAPFLEAAKARLAAARNRIKKSRPKPSSSPTP